MFKRIATVTALAVASAATGAGIAVAATSGMTTDSWHCGRVGVDRPVFNATNCRRGSTTTTTRPNLVQITHPK